MNALRNSTKIIILAAVMLIAASGCKSSKKAAEAARAAAEEKARTEQEASLKKQQEEDRRKQELEEQAQRAAEARKQQESATSTPAVKLNQYFSNISNSGNLTSANNSITEALTMFASDETPVLIVISGSGDSKDYDRPTTIRKYLNYLKDQKKNINSIEKLEFDDSGKITSVELRKN